MAELLPSELCELEMAAIRESARGSSFIYVSIDALIKLMAAYRERKVEPEPLMLRIASTEFEFALSRLRSGHRVRRKHWRSSLVCIDNRILHEWPSGAKHDWQPTVADLLSHDWVVL